MYLNTLGGSGVLHIIAGYPRIVALFGIIGAVAMLASPNGPGNYIGGSKALAGLERTIAESADARLTAAKARAEVTMALPAPALEEIVSSTLRKCGVQCSDVMPSTVLGNPALLRKVILLHELDGFSGGHPGNPGLD